MPVPTLTREQWREVVRVADADTGPSTRLTVDVAGFQVALRALEMTASTAASVLVLVGPGATGAVGAGAARHLANRGVATVVVTARRPAEASGPLGHELLALAETPAQILPFSAAFDVASFALVVDAVLGRGIDEAPRTAVMGLVRAVEAASGPVLSVDIPSGVDPDSGAAAGAFVRPSSTIALGLPAVGLRHAEAGNLVLADIGWTAGVYARAGIVVPTIFGVRARVELTRESNRAD